MQNKLNFEIYRITNKFQGAHDRDKEMGQTEIKIEVQKTSKKISDDVVLANMTTETKLELDQREVKKALQSR